MVLFDRSEADFPSCPGQQLALVDLVENFGSALRKSTRMQATPGADANEVESGAGRIARVLLETRSGLKVKSVSWSES